ncbi:MAG: endo-1,4-beta-xylanase [Planctomycetota bacterium]
MAQLRFRLQDRSRLPDEWLHRLYVAGSEEIPWPTRCSWQGDLLHVERSVVESGCVSAPWPVEGRPRTVLTTATLMVRERPYQLEVELARGLIQRVRNRLFLWEFVGLQTPQDVVQRLHEATKVFARAATHQHDPAEAARLAEEAIRQGLDAGEDLVAHFARQAIDARRKHGPISTLLGVALPPEPPDVSVRRRLLDACNIVQIPMGWRAIEKREGKRDWTATDDVLGWCQTAGIKAIAGPLLRMEENGVPDWMYLWEGDFDNLAGLIVDHVESVVKRYAGRVHLWHVASKVNGGTLLSLDEEQRLQLVALALEAVRRQDPRTPTVVSFNQPWGDYLAQRDDELAPLHYADALVRAELGVSGFGLEIDVRNQPSGTLHRPSFEFGALVDQWSMMGMPLMVSLECGGDGPDGATLDLNAAEKAQRKWAEAMLPLLLARTPVQVVLWNQLKDGTQRASGLLDDTGNAKPTLKLMQDLRKSCL